MPAIRFPIDPSTDLPIGAARATDDLIKVYRAQFDGGVSATSKALTAWAAVLVIMLIQPLVPIAIGLKKAEREYEHLQAQVKSNRRRQDPESRTRIRREEDRSSKDLRSRTEKARVRREKDRSIKESRSRTEKARGGLQKISTPLGSIEVPALSVPPFYSAFAAGLLIFFLYRRALLTTMALKVVQLHLEGQRRPLKEVRWLGAWAPFWLAPLPSIGRDQRGRGWGSRRLHALVQFFGWRHSVRSRSVLLALWLGALAISWIWVINLARRLDRIEPNPPIALVARWEFHAALFVTCAIGCVLYLRPTVVWGAFPERLLDEPIARRRVLQGAGWIGVGAVAVSIIPPELYRYVPFLRRPRFRIAPGSRFPDQAGKFVLNGKVIHYIAQHGRVLGQANLTPPLKIVPRSEVVALLSGSLQGSKYRIHGRAVGTVAEILALQEAARNPALAATIAWNGLRAHESEFRFTSKANERLYSLCAGLHRRAGLPLPQTLVDYIKARGDKKLLSFIAQTGKTAKERNQRWSAKKLRWKPPTT